MLHELEIRMLPGEAWWGGLVNCGWEMPLTEQSCCTVNPFGGEDLDQGAALFLSSRGRCISTLTLAFSAIDPTLTTLTSLLPSKASRKSVSPS